MIKQIKKTFHEKNSGYPSMNAQIVESDRTNLHKVDQKITLDRESQLLLRINGLDSNQLEHIFSAKIKVGFKVNGNMPTLSVSVVEVSNISDVFDSTNKIIKYGHKELIDVIKVLPEHLQKSETEGDIEIDVKEYLENKAGNRLLMIETDLGCVLNKFNDSGASIHIVSCDFSDSNYSSASFGNTLNMNHNLLNGKVYFDLVPFDMPLPVKTPFNGQLTYDNNGNWNHAYQSSLVISSQSIELKDLVKTYGSYVVTTKEVAREVYKIDITQNDFDSIYVSLTDETYITKHKGDYYLHIGGGVKIFYVGAGAKGIFSEIIYGVDQQLKTTSEDEYYKYYVTGNNNCEYLIHKDNNYDITGTSYVINTQTKKEISFYHSGGKVTSITARDYITNSNGIETEKLSFEYSGNKITKITDHLNKTWMSIGYEEDKIRSYKITNNSGTVLDEVTFVYHSAGDTTMKYTTITNKYQKKAYLEFNENNMCVRKSDEKGNFSSLTSGIKIDEKINAKIINQAVLLKDQKGLDWASVTADDEFNGEVIKFGPESFEQHHQTNIKRFNNKDNKTIKISGVIDTSGDAHDSLNVMMWFNGKVFDQNTYLEIGLLGKNGYKEYTKIYPELKNEKWQLIAANIYASQSYDKVTVTVIHLGLNKIYASVPIILKNSGNVVTSTDGPLRFSHVEKGIMKGTSKNITKVNGNEINSYLLNSNDNVVKTINDEGVVTEITYDGQNNQKQIKVTTADGVMVENYTYNNNSAAAGHNQLLGWSGDNNNSQEYKYDSAGRMINVLDWPITNHQYTLDESDQIKKYQINGIEGQSIDAINLDSSSYLTANNNNIKYSFDRKDKKLDVTVNGNTLLKEEYDKQDRLKRMTRGNDDVHIVYDDNGQVGAIIEENSENTELSAFYNYDQEGKLTSVSKGADVTSESFVEFTYNENDKVSVVQTANSEIEYFYDNLGQVQSVIESAHGLKQFEYDHISETRGHTFANFMLKTALKYNQVFSDYVLRTEELYGLKSDYVSEGTVREYDNTKGLKLCKSILSVDLKTVNNTRFNSTGELFKFKNDFDNTKTVYGWVNITTASGGEYKIFTLEGCGNCVGLLVGNDNKVKVNLNGLVTDTAIPLNEGFNFVYMSVKAGSKEVTVIVNGNIVKHKYDKFEVKEFSKLIVGDDKSEKTFHLRTLTVGANNHLDSQVEWIYKKSKPLLEKGNINFSGFRMKDLNSNPNIETITLRGTLISDKFRRPSTFTLTDDSYIADKNKLYEYDSETLTHVYASYSSGYTGSKQSSLLEYNFDYNNEATIGIKVKPILPGVVDVRRTVISLVGKETTLNLCLDKQDNLDLYHCSSYGNCKVINSGIKLQTNVWHDIVLKININITEGIRRFELYVKKANGQITSKSGNIGNVDTVDSGSTEPPISSKDFVEKSKAPNKPTNSEKQNFNLSNTLHLGAQMSGGVGMFNFNGQFQMLKVSNSFNTSHLDIMKNGEMLEQKRVYDKLGRVRKKYLSSSGSNLVEFYTYKKTNGKKYSTTNISGVIRRLNDSDEIWQNYTKGFNTFDKITEKYDINRGIVNEKIIGNQKTYYQYDDLNRLVKERIDTPTKSQVMEIEYLPNGNISKKTYKNLLGNLLYTETYHYDSVWSDRLLKIESNKNGVSDFIIEYGNNLDRPSSYGDKELRWLNSKLVKAGTSSYQYNHNGIRTSKNVNGKVTEYWLNGDKIIGENKPGIGSTSYIYDEVGMLVGLEVSGKKYVYLRDITGNINYIVDTTGKILVSYIYDAWGSILSKVGHTDEGAKVLAANSFYYKGYYYDEESKWYYLNSRYYDPKVGRFISADNHSYLDFNSIGGLNLYAYCLNNPVMYSDSTGTSPSSIWKGLATLGIAILVVGAIAGITVISGGLAAPVLWGAVIGGVVGGGISAGMQLMTTGSINFGQLLVDISVGAVMGAFGGSGLGRWGMAVASSLTGTASSIATDIVAGSDIRVGAAIIMGVMGFGLGALGGPGAQHGKMAARRAALNRQAEMLAKNASGGYTAQGFQQAQKSINQRVINATTNLRNTAMTKIYEGIYPNVLIGIASFPINNWFDF